nr:hypothetical protein [Chenggangzhangella methanolivorans]
MDFSRLRRAGGAVGFGLGRSRKLRLAPTRHRDEADADRRPDRQAEGEQRHELGGRRPHRNLGAGQQRRVGSRKSFLLDRLLVAIEKALIDRPVRRGLALEPVQFDPGFAVLGHDRGKPRGFRVERLFLASGDVDLVREARDHAIDLSVDLPA